MGARLPPYAIYLLPAEESMVTKVNCPNCQTPVEWGPQSPFRPFCSKRCQLIDLGEWADEEKRIPGPINPDLLPYPDEGEQWQ